MGTLITNQHQSYRLVAIPLHPIASQKDGVSRGDFGEDLEPLLTELEAGKTPGDRLQIKRAVLYKARIKNSDAKREKAGVIGSFIT